MIRMLQIHLRKTLILPKYNSATSFCGEIEVIWFLGWYVIMGHHQSFSVPYSTNMYGTTYTVINQYNILNQVGVQE